MTILFFGCRMRSSIEIVALKLAAVAAFGFGLLWSQGTQIPNWWFSADPKKVLADPLFPTLALAERKQVLSQIDPKFAKLSKDKQDSFLWNAETEYLPKADTPSAVFTWTPNDPNSASEIVESALTRSVSGGGLRVAASLERHGFFFSHIRITNNGSSAVEIRTKTFLILVVKPKQFSLFFEYPSRVSYRVLMASADYSPGYIPTERTTVSSATGRPVARIDSPDPVARQKLDEVTQSVQTAGFQYSLMILRNALQDGIVNPGATAVGDVYFESSSVAREVIVRVFCGGYEYDLPFTVPKTR